MCAAAEAAAAQNHFYKKVLSKDDAALRGEFLSELQQPWTFEHNFENKSQTGINDNHPSLLAAGELEYVEITADEQNRGGNWNSKQVTG